MADEQQPDGKVLIRLDGSFGPGPMAELTITTKTGTGGDETVQYTVPYLLIDVKRLQVMSDMNFIVGYGIKKQPDARLAALRELGLG
jgi:hypothetical protein